MRRHLPIPKHKMEVPPDDDVNTICSVLRDIYWLTNNEEIKLKCRVATSMAKSMSRRLRKYKDEASYSKPGFWERKSN